MTYAFLSFYYQKKLAFVERKAMVERLLCS